MTQSTMNAERLLALYERVADAPDAIDRLRRFVLDLAVRGKLVEQDPDDEPASESIRRIAAKKEQLVSAGEIRKPRPQPPVTDPPFALPFDWTWARLGTITAYIQRGRSPKYAVVDGTPVVSQKCVQWNGLDLAVAKQVRLDSLAEYDPIRFLRDGDLLWNSTGTGTIGRVIRLTNPPQQLVCDSHVTVVRCLDVDPEYIRTWMRTDHVYGAIEERAAGSTNQVELTAQMANGQPVPLPPLAEQKRIVAKVNELSALLDRLEATRTAAEATRDRMTAASLTRLTASDATPETFPAHARFALDALPALTVRADQIQSLRQTILNLAVRGKLVEQDPTDEPASELLKRIAENREIEKRRRGKLEPVSRDELAFGAPTGWKWARFGEVFSMRTGFAFKSSTYDETGILVFRVVNFNRNGSFDLSDARFIPESLVDKKLQGFLLEPGDILMVMVGGSIGKTTRITAQVLPALLNQNMWRMRSYGKIMSNDYEYLLLRSINQEIENLTASTHGHFSMADYEQKPVCVPPLSEQYRIAAKVDELMALCDRLDNALSAADTTKLRLFEALLHDALTPTTARETEAA